MQTQWPEPLASPSLNANSRLGKRAPPIRPSPLAVPMAVSDGQPSTAPYQQQNGSASPFVALLDVPFGGLAAMVILIQSSTVMRPR
jgi:hypothetical protein